MTERRRIPGDPRLGFHRDDLEGEACLDCGAPADVAVEEADGLAHYCRDHHEEDR